MESHLLQKRIPNSHFPILPNDIIDDLSTDQYYAYRLCSGIMIGDMDEDLSLMECGPLCHARWVTLGCRLLRWYVSVGKPCKELRMLAEFCILVYFPLWFTIKRQKYFTDGPQNYYEMINNKITTISKLI